MKRWSLVLFFSGLFAFQSNAQSRYLSDIIPTKSDRGGYTRFSFNYWRHDTCLYSKQMCRYNTATAAPVKVSGNRNVVKYEFLRGNANGYPGHNQYDTLIYYFHPENINASKLLRKLLIVDKYKSDTFDLVVIDTLLFSNSLLIKKAFGKKESVNQKSLKIYVLKSVDDFGSPMLHYWAERIGVVKLTDEKCWRYSFEMDEDSTKSIEKCLWV